MAGLLNIFKQTQIRLWDVKSSSKNFHSNCSPHNNFFATFNSKTREIFAKKTRLATNFSSSIRQCRELLMILLLFSIVINSIHVFNFSWIFSSKHNWLHVKLKQRNLFKFLNYPLKSLLIVLCMTQLNRKVVYNPHALIVHN